MIGRLRQNGISARASFAVLSFKVLLLSSMCATASFSFRKFSDVFSIWTNCLFSKSAGKNMVIIAAGVPLFFRRACEEIEIFEVIKIGRNTWKNWEKTGQNWAKLGKTGENWGELGKTGRNWAEQPN